ncbi:MAG: hypothetical protein M5U34_10525 [Chloroflexi bacterium]|nr:hypothetical protein [Chloroflexota bacterium]
MNKKNISHAARGRHFSRRSRGFCLTAMPVETEEEMMVTAVSAATGNIPDMDRYRNFWLAPFLILSTVTALLGLFLRSTACKRKPFGALFCLGPLSILPEPDRFDVLEPEINLGAYPRSRKRGAEDRH